MVGASHALGGPGAGDGAGAAGAARRAPAPTVRRPTRIRSSPSAPTRSVYDSNADVVTASGEVRMNREGNYLAADQVIWDRKIGRGLRQRQCRHADARRATSSSATTSSSPTRFGRHGRQSHGRARKRRPDRRPARHAGQRRHDLLQRDLHALPGDDATRGCPKRPSWSITAARVIDDPKSTTDPLRGRPAAAVRDQPAAAAGLQRSPRHRRRDRLARARLRAFEPQRASRSRLPYHWQIAPNRDSDDHAAHLHRRPAGDRASSIASSTASARSRSAASSPTARIDKIELDRDTADRRAASAAISTPTASWQLDPEWSITDLASRRDRQDRHAPLRHHQRRPAAQRRQRRADHARQLHLDRRLGVPGTARRRQAEADPDRAAGDRRALPARRHRRRHSSSSQANSLAITRIDGQDTQRAFASADGTCGKLTPWGQEVTFTAYGRGDVYHTDDAAGHDRRASTAAPNGWHARAIGALAADVQWPFIGPLFGGVQRLVPRVQLVLTPPTPNLDIPNEDARSVDLEDSNLFALNRFPGYDRWEDASRITYGFDWSLERNNMSIDEHDRPKLSVRSRCATFSPKEPALPAAFRTSSEERASATAASSTSRTATASTRTTSPSAATRST